MADLTPTRKRLVRLAFAAVAAWWLLAAALLAAGAGEIYPAIAMPAFNGAAGYAHGEVGIERMEAAFLHSRGETVVSQRRLLATIPDSHHGAIAHLLAPPRPDRRPLRDWLRRHLLPGMGAGRVTRDRGCIDPSLAPWLRARAAALLPGERVSAVEIRWYHDTFRPPARAPASRRAAGVVRVPLDGGAACAG
jgi:hypothetical protein